MPFEIERNEEHPQLISDAFDILHCSTSEFASHLSRQGVEYGSRDGKLRITAPVGVLTEKLQTELRRRKADLLAYLEDTRLQPAGPAAPLSFAQQRLWIVDRLYPDTATYNIPQCWLIHERIDEAIFADAVHHLVRRHPALRTRIEIESGDAIQRDSQAIDAEIAVTDLTGKSNEDGSDETIDALLIAEGRRPFSLTQGPLIRFLLVQLSGGRSIVSYNIHHIVADQRSLNIIKFDLSRIYTALVKKTEPSLLPLTLDYFSISREQRSDRSMARYAADLVYWRERLSGEPKTLDLSSSRLRDLVNVSQGSRYKRVIDSKLTERLNLFATANQTSLYVVMLTLFALLLNRYSGETDFCLGTPISTRKRRDEEDIVGLFVNMLPIRCALSLDDTFPELLRKTRNEFLLDLEHSDIPFQFLVTELYADRSTPASTLFQITFALNPRAEDPVDSEQELDLGISKFDLSLQINEKRHQLESFFEYRTDLFDSAEISRLADHYVQLAESLLNYPDQRVGSVRLLTPADQDALAKFNATNLDYNRADTIISLFDEQVRMHPSAIALYTEQQSFTFTELDRRATALSIELRINGVGGQCYVGICLPRTSTLIVAILAVLKTGAAYLPLDPKYPDERLAYMLADSGTRTVIAHEVSIDRLSVLGPDLIIIHPTDESTDESRRECSRAAPNLLIQPADAAYVIYTSGSTGKPKGTVIEHRNTVALIAWARSYFDPNAIRTVLASTSICFDLSIFEIFLPLSTGNSIVLVEDILALPASRNSQRVTLINTVPSAINALLDAGIPSSVRTVCLAGELLATELVNRVYASGVRQVFDLYGPTETTTYSTVSLRLANAPPNIGCPIANTRIYLLDSSFNQVPPLIPGEVFIGGDGVSRGYLGNPEMTAQRFLSLNTVEPLGRLYRTGDVAKLNEDGVLVYCGRRDHQIKIRGHRIELGEIETALREIAGVSEIAVVAQDHPGGGQLVAFVAGCRTSTIQEREWIENLRHRLPGYMVPSFVFGIPTMPKTLNGKIDRLALSQNKQQNEMLAEEAPSDLLEQWLANIFAKQLRTKSIHRNSHFFDDLGGHSLAAFQIFVEIEKGLGLALALTSIFSAPSIALLAKLVRSQEWVQPKFIRLIRSGNGEPVTYHVMDPSQTQEIEHPGNRRAMAIDPAALLNVEALAKELANFELSRPPIELISAPDCLGRSQALAARLNQSGFQNVRVSSSD